MDPSQNLFYCYCCVRGGDIPLCGALSMIEATIGVQPPLKFWELTGPAASS
jgi:hypothetical protein